MQGSSRDALRLLVGTTALVAPALHSATDIMEWQHGGFSALQLWLNYLAFLPMPWLLLGICATRDPGPGWIGLWGALLYGAAFTYFAHTTLLAMETRVATYDALWTRLGGGYTANGALMVCGGLLFSWSALRTRWLPTMPVLLFLGGICANLALTALPVPDLFQVFGSGLRNLGLMAMGHAILSRPRTEPRA